MPNKVFALLIAIDKYRNPVPPLNGCVRDSNDMRAWLEANVPQDRLSLRALHDEQATKANIVDAFLKHLCQAGPQDAVFIHYAGHGSQEAAAPEFWHIEPDKLNETLVCYDSRQVVNGVMQRDMADKELGALLYQVSLKGPHMAMVMDCCHSGSGARDTSAVTSRQSPADRSNPRPVEEYVFMQRSEFDRSFADALKSKREFKTLPESRCVILSACRSIQTAKELNIGGKNGGVFTYALIQALTQTRADISYRDLAARAGAVVRNKVADQEPLVEVLGKADANANFLTGAARPADDFYFVHWSEKERSWLADAGLMHGIPPVSQGETTLALFAANVNPSDPSAKAFAEAKVLRVESSFSAISFDGAGAVAAPDATFRARILRLPISRTRVRVEAEVASDAAQKKAVELLKSAAAAPQPARYIEVVTGNADADYVARAYEHEGVQKYSIHRPGDNQPLVAQIEGFNERSAAEVMARFSAISRFDRTRELNNPTTQIRGEDGVEMEVYFRHRDPANGVFGAEMKAAPDDSGNLLIPYYTYPPLSAQDPGASPQVRVKINNRSGSRRYFVALYYMSSNFSAQNVIFENSELGPGESLYALNGDYFLPQIDEALLKLGLKSDIGYFKLMVSTTSFNASLLEQSGFEYPQSMRSAESGAGAVDAMLEETRSRGLVIRKNFQAAAATDWTTALVGLRTMLENKTDDSAVLASAGITVKAPKGKQVKVTTGSIGGSRDTESAGIAGANLSMLDPAVFKPFDFVAGRGDSPSANVLEISGIDDPSSITPKDPLVISLQTQLAENEGLLTVIDDGGVLVPIVAVPGEDGSQELRIGRMPAPAPGTRSIGGTIKLVVQKFLAGTAGVGTYDYPRLMLVTEKEGKASFNHDAKAVAEAVKKGKRVLLLVHGITSTCDECFLQGSGPGSLRAWFGQRYDVVLAFDYETYNTPLEKTANDLKSKLKAAGLDAGHGKTLHILAHSMGGLLSRYFIEVLGGKSVVNHLIMCGTPNGGSPWVSIKQFATFAFTMLLNKIPVVGAAATVTGVLLKILKVQADFDKTTQAMKPGSDFLNLLKNSADPALPYTILAGNTSMIPKDRNSQAMIGKVMDKIGVPSATSKVIRKVLKEDNDIAVAVSSIHNVPGERNPKARLQHAACNHFGYFSGGVGSDLLKAEMEKI